MNLNKLIIIIFAVVLFNQKSWAQDLAPIYSHDIEHKENRKTIKQVVYLELAGSAVGYSINYERRLNENVWGRIGGSYFPASLVKFAGMPIGLSYLFGDLSHFLETGFVATPAYADVDYLFGSKNKEEFGIILSPTIGYRYHPKEKGLLLKIAFTPLFTPFNTKFLPSGGLSLGYSF